MNSIIVDDEPLAREGLLTSLQDIAGTTITGSFNSAKKAALFMQENKVDLIFLDIHMPRINGLVFAASIPKETLIIFTTAYSHYAAESYEVDAIDYLIKPIQKERLERAVGKALAYHNMLNHHGTTESIEKDFILIKAERRYHKILFKDILYIEGLKDYVVIYTGEGKIITAMNLRAVHRYLNADTFTRVSKSYIVNLSYINSFNSHTIYIRQFEIPIGEVFRKSFLEVYLGKELSDKY